MDRRRQKLVFKQLDIGRLTWVAHNLWQRRVQLALSRTCLPLQVAKQAGREAVTTAERKAWDLLYTHLLSKAMPY